MGKKRSPADKQISVFSSDPKRQAGNAPMSSYTEQRASQLLQSVENAAKVTSMQGVIGQPRLLVNSLDAGGYQGYCHMLLRQLHATQSALAGLQAQYVQLRDKYEPEWREEQQRRGGAPCPLPLAVSDTSAPADDFAAHENVPLVPPLAQALANSSFGSSFGTSVERRDTTNSSSVGSTSSPSTHASEPALEHPALAKVRSSSNITEKRDVDDANALLLLSSPKQSPALKPTDAPPRRQGSDTSLCSLGEPGDTTDDLLKYLLNTPKMTSMLESSPKLVQHIKDAVKDSPSLIAKLTGQLKASPSPPASFLGVGGSGLGALMQDPRARAAAAAGLPPGATIGGGTSSASGNADETATSSAASAQASAQVNSWLNSFHGMQMQQISDQFAQTKFRRSRSGSTFELPQVI